ncbi:MAG: substrate-binding domain-containing protein [Spirochaetaceae bacterium]|jgi:phosphate transport system substrate-binding protein|nr:substrate-binding domain-containing protein [Spirochaetaceae bacterium]
MKTKLFIQTAGAAAAAAVIAAVLTATFAACAPKKPAFEAKTEITVISREDGSGTRGAFIELFEIEMKNADGTRKDLTTKEAVVARQTDIVMGNVAGNKYAIGYISLGSLNSTVKALAIGGADATPENVRQGKYTIARPFYIAVKDDAGGAANPLAEDFIAFILSAEGQAVVGKGYIPLESAGAWSADAAVTGKVVVAGSSSVTPVMEKLREAYIAQKSGAVIEIQQSDSSAGLVSLAAGACDIAMVSRELKPAEKEKARPIQIATDGIAVIVNNENPLSALNKELVKAIYTGRLTRWEEAGQ